MTRKALWLLPVSLAAVVASQWRDISRNLKIEWMSAGQGFPQLVLAAGGTHIRTSRALGRPMAPATSTLPAAAAPPPA